MKGAFFQKPIEWQIDVQGESWTQQDQISGVVTVKNTGTEPWNLCGGVQLAHAEMKKVHSRDAQAFKQESSALFAAGTLAPGASQTLPFSFTLPANCPVTDKKASFYVAYGPGLVESNLQLNITPMKLFGEVIKLFETFQRFKLKEIKATKGAVEYKLLAPTSREFAHVEALHLMQSLEGEALKLDFHFKVKALDMQSVTTKVAKEERHLTRLLTPREYRMGKDMLNQDGVLKAITETLGQIKMTGL